jgi:methylase of polypeptide subunit release factors
VSSLPAPPAPDAEVARALRDRLAALEYSDARVVALMEGTAWLTSPSDIAIVGRRLTGDGPFETAFRLFFLGLEVEASAAERALAPVSLASLAGIGVLARDGSTVRSLVQLAPVGSLIAAADLGDSLRGPRDFVTGRTPSTMALVGHTIRAPVASALDVGCGNGVQALAAARHAESVVATDVNPRALAFTRFNAALNGLANVDCREGPWFEPVAGERFDLIVGNPPFLVSPESAFLYRDAGLPGDSVSRDLVAGAAEHLADGGFAHLVCNWAHPPEDWTAPLRRWVAETGCDAWALCFSSRDALRYAASWNAHLKDADPAEFEAVIARWLDYYETLGIEAIAYGLVIMRRRSSGSSWFRAAAVRGFPSGDPTAHLTRLFAADQARDDEALLAARLTPAPGQMVDQRLVAEEPGYRTERAIIRVAPGVAVECEVDGAAIVVLKGCDGRRSLREVVAENGGHDAAILPAMRRLLELGLVTAS